ncbi:hypothetical protein CGLO_11173 [Colletotrichum gloeosporioides Cg-14]|uniref:Glutathione S-transferase n=1 Tax=Colletotrichum gloeosporioides (strain Cg-14) TaxID=1237896 RepID=T0KBQ7_COLGC|nr:hypothetical protein CGLO_11173 [Colletotrichum gloeosporioides Cg-14]
MPSVDTSIYPNATGAAAQLVAKHSDEHALKLYAGWFCPFVQRTWIVLHEKQIPYQYIEINPYKKDPEFLRLNPRGLVPTLAVPVDVKGNEQKPLYDSTVLCEYLEEAYAGNNYGPHLLPEEPYERARCRLWIDHINSRIVPAFYKFIQHTPEKEFTIDEARDEFLGHLKTFARELDPEGPWFLGKAFGLVDIMLAPWAMRLFLFDHYKPGGLGLPQEGKGGEDDAVWKRWRQWYDAVEGKQTIKDTLSDRDAYIDVYKRYAEDKTNSEVGQATRGVAEKTLSPSKPATLSALPTPVLLRSLLVSAISSKPYLLGPSLSVLSFLTRPNRSLLFDVDRNPVLHSVLKTLFYRQFCAGESPAETKDTMRHLRFMGFRGTILTYAKETVFDHKTGTEHGLGIDAEKDAKSGNCSNIEVWRKGALETVDLLGEGDQLALK